ncbi:RICIN domain-containing protein [Actinomadura hibisca]|uniref:RICIN domain-containing protein n=1 Tax=Actinomadura hibisca TaxID=68565 RepID=UPI000831F84B|nr:ricin-type beta-trefoil lectin domain protein [Actinomadura hibisca]
MTQRAKLALATAGLALSGGMLAAVPAASASTTASSLPSPAREAAPTPGKAVRFSEALALSSKRKGKNLAAGYRLRSLKTGLCLNSNGNGTVYGKTCDSTNYQRWNGGDFSTLVSQQTDWCLDGNGYGKVYTKGCNATSYQSWWFEDHGRNCWEIYSDHTRLRLDGNGNGSVYAKNDNDTTYQRWCIT